MTTTYGHFVSKDDNLIKNYFDTTHTDANKQIGQQTQTAEKLHKINQFLALIYQELAKTPSHIEPVIDFTRTEHDAERELIHTVREMTAFDAHGQPTSFMPSCENKWNGQGAVDALISGLEAQKKMCTKELYALDPTFEENEKDHEKFGYNLALDAILMGTHFQDKSYAKVNKLKEQHDQVTEKLRRVNELLQIVHREKAKTPKNQTPVVEFTRIDHPAERELVKIVRTLTTIDVHGQPTSFLPPNKYKWSGQEIDALTSGLESQQKMCMHEISTIYPDVQHNYEILNHYLDSIAEIQKNERESRSRILQNMR